MKNVNHIKPRLLLVCFSFALILPLLSSLSFAIEKISVWTYYPSVPFITGEQQGLSYELVELLNIYSKGQYHFELKLLPRPRIDRYLAKKFPGMVLFVNGSWMGDSNKSKYLWSLPILADQNEVISRSQGKTPVNIHFNGAESLHGMVFGGVLGHRYQGLESAFKKGGIERRNVQEERLNLKLLLLGRIDVTTLPATVIHYQLKRQGLEDEVFLSPTPLFSYHRHFLIVKKLKHMKPFIDQFIQSLEKNKQWHKIKEKYAVN